ncbi:MFS domain-containing protein [Meloidogyne graminicola]|uniref:MFS domain-containing protein n=1 Tax=Meloidogyne graminicola TaxID=189291 RepID=A0A8S9ZPT1_9BILA|nr:MFS domain-containing protein [Meloidogyne graminicola]
MSDQQPPPSTDDKIENAGAPKEVEQREPLLVPGTTEDEQKAKIAVPDGHWTKSLIFAVLAAAFGSSFQFGYHIGCINLPADLIKQWFSTQMIGSTNDEVNSRWGIAVGIFAFGGIFGGYFVGKVAMKFGRKRALLYNNALAIIAGALMAGAKFVGNYWIFILGRFIIGLNSGLNSGLAPMYLTEISPANLRGAIGSFAQLFVTIAILFSQILGLPFLLGTVDRWPLIFAFTFVPVIVQLCALPFCAETPAFNMAQGKRDQAEKDLKKLRDREDVSDELNLIHEEGVKSSSSAPTKVKDIYGTIIPWPLILALFMMVSQQLSGINAAMFYSTAIFKGAGLKDQWPNYATIAMGAINVLMTVVSVYLVEHPRFGRRTLHIAGMIGMCFSSAMIAISMLVAKLIEFVSFFSIIFVLLFVVSFATGPGSIPWFYVNELFQSNLRGVMSSYAVVVNWICVVVVATFFPIIDGILHEYSFFVFTALLLIFILFAFKFLPETKNKTLEQINEEMNNRRGVKTKTNNPA